MLGSHNSMTYLPITGWGRVLRPWVRCQSLTLMEQYECGVRNFDIRIRPDKIGYQWRFCHNNVLLDDTVRGFADIFRVAQHAGVYFRFIYDIRRKPQNADEHHKIFTDYVRYLQFERGLQIDSAICMWEWRELLPTRQVTQQEYHASVSAPWYKYILGCRWFAKHHNRKAMQELCKGYVAGKEALLLDYVEYQ